MKPVLIVLAVLAVLIGGAVAAWMVYQESVRPFDGETHHDFGIVPVPGDKVIVSHVFTLRNRFGLWSAALLSAGFFSAVHFYSLPGFLMTFWSGFVWAIAFERARSLIPGIAAHTIYNLLFVAGVLLTYR